MRLKALLVLALPVALAGCGTTNKTVVVNPPAGSTVVVPPSGPPQVTPNNTSN